MVGERPDVGALRLRRAHRRPNDPERGQTTRESGREPDESSKSGCSTDTAIAAIGSKSRILNSLLGGVLRQSFEMLTRNNALPQCTAIFGNTFNFVRQARIAFVREQNSDICTEEFHWHIGRRTNEDCHLVQLETSPMLRPQLLKLWCQHWLAGELRICVDFLKRRYCH